MKDWAESFDRALSELRFEDASAIAASSGEPVEHLEARVSAERVAAEAAARALHGRIAELARNNDYRSLLEIARSEEVRLLGMLRDETEKRSRVHLKGAERWAERQLDTNRRRLDEARKALEAVDLDFASALVAKLDEDFVDETMQSERNDLLLAITARTLEVEELSSRAADVAAEVTPPRRRWWRRRN